MYRYFCVQLIQGLQFNVFQYSFQEKLENELSALKLDLGKKNLHVE